MPQNKNTYQHFNAVIKGEKIMFGLNTNVPEITVEELKKLLASNEKYTLVDVRTADEYSRGKIRGSINVPLDDLASKIESIIPDKSAKIYVYCLSGSRSLNASHILQKLGYKNICNVKSGLLAWQMHQYPME